jgi:hypothetical protein
LPARAVASFSAIRSRFLSFGFTRELPCSWHGICIAPLYRLRELSMNRHSRFMLLFGLLLISAALLGCANDARRADTVPPSAYDQDLDRARASIAEAERAGAAEFGSAQITLAREKLRAAEDAANDGATDRAVQLAVEAELDADLAAAIARNQQTQALAAEVRSTLRTLEDELRRTAGGDLTRP